MKEDKDWLLLRWCCAVACAAVALRLLLVPAYRSTDFEVHRNWLAITHSLPWSQWYTDTTSVWTLDYPPLFACFEWALSHVAKHFDAGMLVVQNLNYASPATVLFQRLSVTATDVCVLFTAAYALARSAGQGRTIAHGVLLFTLITCNAGLLIVDHVHFQYNGLLIGLLLWSVHLMMHREQDWLAGTLFACLLCMKHLFLFCGPVFLVHILRHWCFPSQPASTHNSSSNSSSDDNRKGSNKNSSSKGSSIDSRNSSENSSNWVQGCVRFVGMGITVLSVMGCALGPFVRIGQASQLAARLFPFGRGLTHAYWAANFWAFYCGADKVLAAVLPGLAKQAVGDAINSASGTVGVAQLRVLPQITPLTTALLVLASLLPALASLWKYPQPRRFAAMIAYSCLCGFWLGYHVHEKAVLPALLVLAIPAVEGHPSAAQDFLVLSSAALYGLLPLLFQPQEHLLKLLLVVCYYWMASCGLGFVHSSSNSTWGAKSDKSGGAVAEEKVDRNSLLSGVRKQGGQLEKREGISRASEGRLFEGLNETQSHRQEAQGEQRQQGLTGLSAGGGAHLEGPLARAYLAGFVLLELYCSVLHAAVWGERLPFLPLMLTSLYCALGVGWVWVRMLLGFITPSSWY